MAWIRVVDETGAEGKLAEVYAGVKRNRGKVANVVRVQSFNPAAMQAHMDLYLAVMFAGSGLSGS